jgi:hypothetical protein
VVVRRLAFLVVLTCALAPVARAGPGLLVGVDDDGLKWQAAGDFLAPVQDLGLGAVRVTFRWRPGRTRPSFSDSGELANIAAAATMTKVVVEVGAGRPSVPPRTRRQRAQYCAYLVRLLRAAPGVKDVVIWTEANQPRFWRHPDARAYVALLARCYDALHRARRDVNVIASVGPHKRIRGAIAPARWYRQLGAAFRASGRRRPIFDTVGHNAYPDSPFEPPWTVHRRGGSIDEGDYARLMRVLSRAFHGTAQPLPGRRGVTIWYLEDGYQSSVGDRRRAYRGRENVAELLDPGFQGWQLQASVRLAYCQPAVGAFFNFQLRDDPDLVGWQSGVLYADGTPKPAYDLLKDAVYDVAAGTVAC